MGVRIFLNDSLDTVLVYDGAVSSASIKGVDFYFDKSDSGNEVTLRNSSDVNYRKRILSYLVQDKSGRPIGTYTEVINYLNSLIEDGGKYNVELPDGAATESTLVDIKDQTDKFNFDGDNLQVVNFQDNYATRLDDKTTSKTIYIGIAVIGASESDAVWQMQKVDTSSGADVTWADGDDNFDNIWDDRASLSYS